jgi:hypothetical protein
VLDENCRPSRLRDKTCVGYLALSHRTDRIYGGDGRRLAMEREKFYFKGLTPTVNMDHRRHVTGVQSPTAVRSFVRITR